MPPVAAGVFLRLFNLRGQVLGGDEMHAVRAALGMPVGELLVTYQSKDNCLPLSALYRLLMDHGVVFSELTFRLPVLLAGILLLAVGPLAVAHWVGRGAAILFAWLLAVSPLLVLYGRIVRSYSPIVLLSFAAALCFYAWSEERRPARSGWAAAYVGLGGLAVYFHLVAAPIVAAPLAFAAVEAAAAGRAGLGRRLRPLVAIGLGLLFALACFLVPARASLERLIGEKRQEASVDFETLSGYAQLEAGTTVVPLALLFWLAAAGGLAALFVRRRRFALFTLTLVAGQVAGLLLLAPLNVDQTPQFTRYSLVLLPWILLWAASGLAASWWPRQGRGGRLLQGLAVAALVAALVAAGPLARPAFAASSFVHHRDFLAFSQPLARLPASEMPGFYRTLAAESDDGAIVEMPWQSSWRFARVPYVYQALHGRRVLVSSPEPLLADPRIAAFRAYVPALPDRLLASPARWVVLHLDPEAEEKRLTENETVPERAMRDEATVWELLRRESARLDAELTAAWGPADRRETAHGSLCLWDLARIRASQAVPPPPDP